MAAGDMSSALMELLGRAKIEQVDFLREALVLATWTICSQNEFLKSRSLRCCLHRFLQVNLPRLGGDAEL